MRMQRNKQKQYHLRRRNVSKDKEGSSVVGYDTAIPIRATIWSASGKVQAEMYGERLSYIKNMLYEGIEHMEEGDGVCVFVDSGNKPDYKIISIKPEHSPIRIELEKMT